jgi:hypothetical protein
LAPLQEAAKVKYSPKEPKAKKDSPHA